VHLSAALARPRKCIAAVAITENANKKPLRLTLCGLQGPTGKRITPCGVHAALGGASSRSRLAA
jgi:hypothetical protein